MHQPDDKRRRDDAAGTLPQAWRRVLGEPAASAVAERSVLGFFLEGVNDDHEPAAHLDVAPVLLTVSPEGRYSRPLPLDSRHLPDVSLTVAEKRLAATLLGLPQTLRKSRSYARFTGALGDQLLAEILDTAPCFFGGVAGLQLSRGKPHPLRWRWNLEKDGSQKLLPDVPASQRLFRVGSLWFLDAEHAEVGPLEAAPEESAWLDLPPLPPESTAAFRAELDAARMGPRVPAPQMLGEMKRAEVSPRPVLVLHALTRHARLAAGTPPLAYGRLAFDYAGERLPGRGGEPLVRRVRNGALLEISRRRAEELASMENLESVGLNPAVDTEGLPWDMADTLPDDAWLFPGKGYAGALEVNTPARWLALRPKLEADGFVLEYAPSFPFEVLEGPVRWYGQAHEDDADRAFDLEIGIEVEGRRVNLLPAVAQALAEHQLSLSPTPGEAEDSVWYAPVDERRRVPVRLKELRGLLAPLAEYLEKPRQQLHLPRVQAGRLEELAQALPSGGSFEAPERLRGFTRRLREAAERASDAVPEGLHAELRGYQRDGLRWMNALAEAGTGGVLADDMGLGKTLQLITHLLALKESGNLTSPALVVVPTSLVPNWISEVARFAPSLTLLALHGPQRAETFTRIPEHDVILTTYALLPRDVETLRKQAFSLVVLDEAQQVKNPRTQARRALLAMKVPRCLCLTGTPLENHLGELWSQLDLAVPGLLGDEGAFRRHYRLPIEKHQDYECQDRLNRRIAPFILRRTKAQVASELPAKTEITRRVVMETKQRDLYESLRLSLAEELREVIAQRGIAHSGIVVLDALLKLRQVCCDPRLVKLEAARGVRDSAKFELLMDMLPALLAEGRRVLLFSQFTEMLKLIAVELDRRRISYVTLTGETRDRAEPVRRFQDGEVPLFLLSLKAGGVGLNLTSADTVIHYDPWWNPAAEAQASDRAHRIGQDKPVFVYRLITAGTVEERIEELKARKAELADAVLEGGGSRERLSFDESDLDALLAPPA
ncbi:DEAD/DEAH box helicase [Luteibacter sp. UNCMF366Tsu5.1]|uniref:DEAD/DEAH box helicase n=1 Tax=Luteibacter sp. UNCMF366Tsu5.1 TaxID=1502758 RepID=UPI000908CE84|nr:DEAD/DEAH box helicase [Luteibacter sp. UNCMF366Tsu5.1]SFW52364.1 Helicase conserved C-terminal domain-containing protein [Luteibacter sp. UNCMF366Tsu5.1]